MNIATFEAFFFDKLTQVVSHRKVRMVFPIFPNTSMLMNRPALTSNQYILTIVFVHFGTVSLNIRLVNVSLLKENFKFSYFVTKASDVLVNNAH